MGQAASGDREDHAVGRERGGGRRSEASGKDAKKKNSFLSCQCGKGRDDKDEVQTNARATNGTKLTEEEWAKVKTGRLHVERGVPDLVQEEADTEKERQRARHSRNYMEDGMEEEKGRGKKKLSEPNHTGSPSSPNSNPRPLDKNALRFKVGDRVKCACTKWGNQFEIGTITCIGYREPSWAADKPDAPYQVKLDKGALVYAPADTDEYVQFHDESWAKQLPPGAPWYLQPGALDRELAKIGAYR
ncbi:hypothetical protein GUITHDRAFT_109811 [Guillardia theta CCMP2712]|uniref:Uncharacterized protein n=1 Tax=Guillardia theta (strain CCMP2712) TaxID=905079 RepID=L1J773_GUITC|nr:hypothetical protein GUITHDRAFT_109811 [Guillardia theta CCMP2712]EKX44361.1 hypothetical protein GUITHDRAFT_109811 [Guillardia theta CCMP2712]|eukprot:XP_005831341.1 hypothetical protein GUITHDRAFT_109811 [Guillardia theta CCMP2712]